MSHRRKRKAKDAERKRRAAKRAAKQASRREMMLNVVGFEGFKIPRITLEFPWADFVIGEPLKAQRGPLQLFESLPPRRPRLIHGPPQRFFFMDIGFDDVCRVCVVDEHADGVLEVIDLRDTTDEEERRARREGRRGFY